MAPPVAVGLSSRARVHGLVAHDPDPGAAAIDEASSTDDHSMLPYLAAILVIATLRFGVNFTRRYATARVGIRVEARLRGLLYHAYLATRARSTTGTRPAR